MKFGRYKVNFKKGSIKEQEDGTVIATCTITGDIEIGIYIETMTWRADWLAEKLFKDNADDYRLSRVENNYEGCSDTVNHVISIWRKK